MAVELKADRQLPGCARVSCESAFGYCKLLGWSNVRHRATEGRLERKMWNIEQFETIQVLLSFAYLLHWNEQFDDLKIRLRNAE